MEHSKEVGAGNTLGFAERLKSSDRSIRAKREIKTAEMRRKLKVSLQPKNLWGQLWHGNVQIILILLSMFQTISATSHLE